MGLIDKMVEGATAFAGLAFAPVGLAVEIPTIVISSKEYSELKEIGYQSKLVCVLTEKLNKEMEQLNSTNLEVGNCVVSLPDIDKQQKYENYYDKAVEGLSKFQIAISISKAEFVNYMMENGEKLEAYIDSGAYHEKLIKLKNILSDETKTPEQKLQILNETVHTGYRVKSKKENNIEILYSVLTILMGIHSVSLFISLIEVRINPEFCFENIMRDISLWLFGKVTTDHLYDLIYEKF